MKAVVPNAENSVTFRDAIAGGVKNWRRFIISIAGSEVAAVLLMLVLVALTTGLVAVFGDHPVSANGTAPTNPCGRASATAPARPTGTPVRVADTSGASGTLAVYTGRGNDTVQRQSPPLSAQSGSLPANACLATAVSDLVRSDGQAIPASQVTSWALTDNTGTRVTVYFQVSPRFGTVTAAGGYTGTVYLDDARAVGANVPVDVHVEYPYLWRAAMLCLAAAWVGFFWAWLINLTVSSASTSEKFWLYIMLQLAVLTIVTFTVLNAQVLTNPDWTGDVSRYLVLATLAAGGALAVTPTLRALIDKVVILWPGGPSAPASTASPVRPVDAERTGQAPLGDGPVPSQVTRLGGAACTGSRSQRFIRAKTPQPRYSRRYLT